jgi:tetratricopeptide (TPR) repeat protein
MLRIFLLISLLFLSVACGSKVAKYNSEGNSRYERGDYEGALLAYHAAQVASPDRPEAYFNAAAALIELDELDLAIAALEQALETADEELSVAAYYNLGNVFFDMGAFELAIDAYQQALLIDPDAADARYNMELALLRFVPIAPTDIEQQTEPDLGFSDPDVTPTDEPGGYEDPTPTPPLIEFDLSATPEMGEGGGGGQDSSTPIPQSQGQMTIEEAERLLDQIQQDQQVLREFLQEEGLTGQTSEKDW